MPIKPHHVMRGVVGQAISDGGATVGGHGGGLAGLQQGGHLQRGGQVTRCLPRDGADGDI